MTIRPLAAWLLLALFTSTTGCDAVGGLLGADGSKSSKKSADETEEEEGDESDDEPKKKKSSKKSSKKDAAATASAASGDAKDFPTPTSFDAPPILAGSYSRLKITKNGKPEGDQLIEILSVEGDQVRVEIETPGPQGSVIVQGLVKVRDRRRASGLDILEAKLKTGAGPVLSLSGAQLGMAQKMLHQQLDIFSYPDAAVEKRREDVTVPAGSFRGCMIYDREGQVPMLNMKFKNKNWVHPAVPTNGVVRIESEAGPDKYVYELVEFGKSGAKASL